MRTIKEILQYYFHSRAAWVGIVIGTAVPIIELR
ncbi:hypothetical protein PAECIP111894_00148 [Paenibacillus pseudetheri]|uniref:Uncharacterized protein n=1 Tax=Paenibacillus pseudetheri TaxID=2897682 RepID=A0ABN8FEM6_9BACL|nr:hypothetical protein PAECIP111894_00148 [Paenibacillus pseudetheri]